MARSRATSVKESIDYIESVVKEITSSEKALTKAKVHCERKIKINTRASLWCEVRVKRFAPISALKITLSLRQSIFYTI